MNRLIKLICLAFVVCLSACSAAEANIEARIPLPEASGRLTNGRTANYKADISKDIKEFDSKSDKAHSLADRVADSAESSEEVERAYAVITGNVAIIGINLSRELEDSKLIQLKRKIEKGVLELSDEIDHVAITAAPELVEKIYGMSANRKNGLRDNGNDALFRVAPGV